MLDDTSSLGLAESLRAAAVEWARRGFRVFPCIPGTKKPYWEYWQTMASSDPEVVRGYWTDMARGGAAHAYNPAYATDEFVVVDLDYKDDPNIGKVYEDEYLGDFDTLEIETPSGGTHLIYGNPGRDVKTVGRLDGHMMDIRAVGGLAMAPGAVFKGGFYRIRAERPIKAPTAAIRGSAGKPRDKSNAGGVAVVDLDTQSAVIHATSIARKAPGATIGSRGSSAYKLAGWMRDAGVSEHICVSLLEEHWAPRCHPPFPTEDTDNVEGLRETVNHLYAYAQNAAGSKSAEALLEGVGPILTPQAAQVFPALAPPPPPVYGRDGEIDEQEPVFCLTPDKTFWGNIPPASSLKPRDWVMHRFLIRQEVSAILAQGGIGKSQISLMIAISLALGKNFLSFRNPLKTAQKTVIYNAEDSIQEMAMRFHAQCLNDHINADDVAPHIMLISGKEGATYRFKATRNTQDRRIVFNNDNFGQLRDIIGDIGLDLLILDPLAKIHEANESDNSQMTRVMEAVERLGIELNCAVLVAHHVAKASSGALGGYSGSADAGRGASTIRDSARACFTLSPLGKDDATRFGMDAKQASYYLRMDDAKMNRGLMTAEPVWLRKHSIDLMTGEQVGAFSLSDLTERNAETKTLLADMLVKSIRDNQGQGGLKLDGAVKLLKAGGSHYSLMTEQDIRTFLRASFNDVSPVMSSLGGEKIFLRKEGGTLTFIFN